MNWNLLELVRDFSLVVLYLGFVFSPYSVQMREDVKPKYKTAKEKSLTSSSKFHFLKNFKGRQ